VADWFLVVSTVFLASLLPVYHALVVSQLLTKKRKRTSGTQGNSRVAAFTDVCMPLPGAATLTLKWW